jgi:spore maturation protein CgeB
MSTDETLSPKEFKKLSGGYSQEELARLKPEERKRIATKAVERILRDGMTPEERIREVVEGVTDGIRKVVGKGTGR